MAEKDKSKNTTDAAAAVVFFDLSFSAITHPFPFQNQHIIQTMLPLHLQ
jgi:hypothetical protein